MAEDYFKERDFDLAEPDDDILSEYAGVCLKTARKALRELEKRGFIKWHESYWLIFRLPVYRYKRVDLMDLISTNSL